LEVHSRIEDLGPVRKKIEVELPPDAVKAEFERVYRGLNRKARIRGFRPGKVPRQVLERYFGEQVREEVSARLIEDSFRQVLEENSIEAVGQPEITSEGASEESGLRFTAMVEVKPAVSVQGYAGIEAERVVEPVTEAEVESELERLRNEHAQMVPIQDRDAAEMGDLVLIDYTAIVGGRPASQAGNRERWVELGSGSFPGDFEAQVVGMRRGEVKRIEVEYPKDFLSPALAGKKVVFRVELKQIGRKELPELDDDFARDLGESGGIEALKEKIRNALRDRAEARAKQRLEEQVVDKLIERNSFEVPASMVERRVDLMLYELGVERVREASKELRSKLWPRALREVKAELVLDDVARQEKIQVDPKEVEQHIASALSRGGQAASRIREMYSSPAARSQLEKRLRRKKALSRIIDLANIEEVQEESQEIAAAKKKS